MQSDELSLRVGQLSSARTRARLACALRAAVELADSQPDPLRIPPLIRRGEVRANRELLPELAERPGSSGPLGLEGLALTSLLVGEAPSALYHKDATASLTAAAFEALAALERGHPTASTSDG